VRQNLARGTLFATYVLFKQSNRGILAFWARGFGFLRVSGLTEPTILTIPEWLDMPNLSKSRLLAWPITVFAGP
jgi:hypothetical protein